jgi:hypothetical protein
MEPVGQLNDPSYLPVDSTESPAVERDIGRELAHTEDSADMTSPTLTDPSEAAMPDADDFAVDNYARQTIQGHTVQFRPGPIAGDPVAIGEQIRQELAERAQASPGAE